MALQIYDPRERALVRLADALLAPVGWLTPATRATATAPGRILLLRLERIGDLLMILSALADIRAAFPSAEIDLVVGSWNRDLAALIPAIDRVETMDVPWLTREEHGASWADLIRQAHGWRSRKYDLVINFEPDVRSNLLARLSGAKRRLGYWTGGGRSLLTESFAYEPERHVADNARQLVARAAGRAALDGTPRVARLELPGEAIAEATALLGGAARPLVGVHVSGGRESKQWHLDRFAEVARALATTRNATIVLTGGPGDRALVDSVKRQLSGVRVIDVSGDRALPVVAALLARLDVLVTGDTGPMHLAAAVGTPLVALFGPSNPIRYGPLADAATVLRVDLPCSPCGQVRLPPVRCRGHVPDCMDGITVERVVTAALAELDRPRESRR